MMEKIEEIVVMDNSMEKGKVGTIGTVIITAYLVLFSIFLLYSLVQFWPPQTSAFSAVNSSNSSVTFFQWEFSISDEGRFFLIVALAGALGSLVHALRSFYWYVGHRELVWSWLAMYIMLPFVGAIIGLVFYLIIRGGFFPQATIQQTNLFGFVALSILVGLFSMEVVLKLGKVAETLLTEVPPGKDAKPQMISKIDEQWKKD